MYIHETRGCPIMEPCVLFLHTMYTEVYTPRCACVRTFRSHTIDHRWSLAIALAVPFIKTIQVMFLLFIYFILFFQNYWCGDRHSFADALVINLYYYLQGANLE